LIFKRKARAIGPFIPIDVILEALIVIQAYKILGTGSYLPDLVVENSRFSEIVETNDEWISSRTGIKSRHLSAGEATWEMGVKAARNAIDMAGIAPGKIDLIIVSTVTPDYISPNMACIIQAELGASNAFCFDINAACTGFIQAFDIAVRYLATPAVRNVLIVSTESLSKLTDYSDRKVCVLFGDGAGAVVISDGSKVAETETGLESDTNSEENVDEYVYECFIGADGTSGHAIVGEAFMPARHPFIPADAPESKPRYEHNNGSFFTMQGQEVYRFATTMMPYAIEKVLERSGIPMDQVDYIVPHQANDRILQSAAKRLGIPAEKMISHLSDMGNTSSASIPICLDREVRAGRIQRGQTLVLTGFGGGLTYGALLCQY